MGNPDFVDHANDILINVYGFWPVQFAKGKGVYLYDTTGKKYLDFGSGIAIQCARLRPSPLHQGVKEANR